MKFRSTTTFQKEEPETQKLRHALIKQGALHKDAIQATINILPDGRVLSDQTFDVQDKKEQQDVLDSIDQARMNGLEFNANLNKDKVGSLSDDEVRERLNKYNADR